MKKPLCCLALTATCMEENLGTLEKYRGYFDLVELRADFLKHSELDRLHLFPALAPKPVILTLRRQQDGGTFSGTEEDRVKLLKQALRRGDFALVDIEEDLRDGELEDLAARKKTRIIRSIHDCSGIPKDIETRFAQLPRNPSDIPKAAVFIRSTAELVRFYQWALNLDQASERIVLGMGDYGFSTRILATLLGNYLTFTSHSANQAAPGHLNPEELQRIYGFKALTRETMIYTVIGNPIMHSFSPRIHNPGFQELNLNAVYLPLQVDHLADFFRLAELLPIRGSSVTLPHKEQIIAFLAEKDPSVTAIGACNTVVRIPGKPAWRGTNTDAEGFIVPLVRNFKSRQQELSQKRATVIGAGGGARAVVYALKQYKVKILILNRTVDKARALAAEFNSDFAPLHPSALPKIKQYDDIIVQTTASGMHPHTDTDPLAWYEFSGHEVVYDIIYNPAQTKLLKRARNSGCPVISGQEMLIEQALAQFKLYTGKPYPDPQRISSLF